MEAEKLKAASEGAEDPNQTGHGILHKKDLSDVPEYWKRQGGGNVKKFKFEGKGNISGERVRELRHRARLSQSALAAKMTTEGTLLRIMNCLR